MTSFVFVVFPSRGPHHRTFKVPGELLGEDLARLSILARAPAEYAFNDREENELLWRIGCRLGVANGYDTGPDLSHYETGDAICGQICGVIIGSGD